MHVVVAAVALVVVEGSTYGQAVSWSVRELLKCEFAGSLQLQHAITIQPSKPIIKHYFPAID